MNTFTIDIDNNITANLSAQDAEAMAGAETFRSEATLAKFAANWPAERLVEIWNGIPGVTPVKKFKDRKTGVSRIWKAIQTLVQEPQPTKPEAAPTPEVGKPKSKATKEATPAEPQATVPADPAPEETQQPVVVEAVPASAEPVPEEVPVAVEASPITESAAEEVKQPEVADAASAEPIAAEPIQAADDNSAAEVSAAPAKTESPEKAKSDGARAGSKAAKILDLMKRAEGVTLKELMSVTGWQAHSVRGYISGTLGKKMGLTVISAKGENGERSYSLKV